MNLAEELKEYTAQLHKLAERHPMQRALMTGRLAHSAYRRYLEQLYLLHAGIDLAWDRLSVELRAGFESPGAIRRATLFDLSQGDDLSECLSICEPVSALIHQLNDVLDPAAKVLGARYVFEGACNGGVYIGRAMRKNYGENCPSHTHLNPYGDEQVARWQRFRGALVDVALSDDERNAVLSGALETFRSFIVLMEHIHPVSEKTQHSGDHHGL
ncbi:MAG: biliverdin-producing heme oxygenase [Myxococcota bacterium]